MRQQSPAFDQVFRALCDPTRRAVIEPLVHGPASMSVLAAPFAMALPSFSRHLDMLENCGLVASSKEGRVRTDRLAPDPLSKATRWLDAQRDRWEQRLDRLDRFVAKAHEKG